MVNYKETNSGDSAESNTNQFIPERLESGELKAQEDRVRCARCHRSFRPKHEGDRFGPKCARKNLLDHLEVKDEKGDVVAVIV